VVSSVDETSFLKHIAEGSELCTGEENGYKITEFRDTSSITSRLHVVRFGEKE